MYSIIDWITDNTSARVYDYTKIHTRKSTPQYHLTLSMSENNRAKCKKWLDQGKGNVAVVFNIGRKKGKSANPLNLEYPITFLDYFVVRGDSHDLRFLDVTPAVIGLYAKGDALFDKTGFVVHRGDVDTLDHWSNTLKDPLTTGISFRKKANSIFTKILDNQITTTPYKDLHKRGIEKNIKLLTEPSSNPKTNKSLAYGYLNYILHLSPYTESGRNLCPMASVGCSHACLHTAGNSLHLKNKIKARLIRSLIFNQERDWFISKLQKEIKKAQIKAIKLNLKLALRLNGTSDIQWEKIEAK